MGSIKNGNNKNACCNPLKPWERQKGESGQAFEAFKLYRDSGLKRSVGKVAETLSKSRQLMSRWKATWDWDERVRAYDNELEKEARKEAARDLKGMTKRHIQISVQLQAKALEALKNMPVEDMSAKDIKEFIKLATDLERLNRSSLAGKEEDETISQDNDIEIYLPEKETL